MHPEEERLVKALDLQPHPEGGYFREVYRSASGVVRDGESGDVLQRASTPAGNATVMIRPRYMAPGFPGFGRPQGRPPSSWAEKKVSAT